MAREYGYRKKDLPFITGQDCTDESFKQIKFFNKQDKNSYKNLKDGFTQFTIHNTPINGATECGRIFAKVLNPLAFKYKKYGTENGHISKDIITQDFLMYNQRNWRDELSEKTKDMTRVEFKSSLPVSVEDAMISYRINRAKKQLRKFNEQYRNSLTEVYDQRHIQDLATQIHHIFPASEFPQIADFLENLIALTPTQHFSYAHPNNNTQYVDKDYQYMCLIAKIGSIRANIMSNGKEPLIYDFDSLLKVLEIGLCTDEFYSIKQNDFNSILNCIEKCY